MAMGGCNKDIYFLIRQFCDEENLPKTVHMFEQETGCFFDMKYFEGLVHSGNLNEAENYLSGFTGIQDNEISRNIYFEIKKHKYLEALERHDVSRALDILSTELKAITSSNEDLYREMTLLVTMNDFRKHNSYSMYGDMVNARMAMMNQIKRLIRANPKFHNKLESPQIEKSRLLRLVNQSSEREQVRSAAQPQTEPQVKALSGNSIVGTSCWNKLSDDCPATCTYRQTKLLSFSTHDRHPTPSGTMPLEAAAAMSVRPMLCQPSVPNINMTTSTTNYVNIPNLAAGLADSMSRGCSNNMQSNPIQHVNSTSNLLNDLPKTVTRSMNMRGASTSMDFHPVNETLLLVGNSGGEIEIWDVRFEVRLFGNTFSIWRREAISVNSLKDIERERCIYVNRVLWSPDGLLLGVALSKHIVQLYAFNVKANSTQKHLEIDTHHGSVNDLAFSTQEDRLFVISCGDDKLIQVWDAMTSSKQYTFEGHTDSVHSLCPHVKEDIHFVFSTSRNGEIKAWVFENIGPRIEYFAPQSSCMRMAYTADGQRLFSCGTSETGESCIVEWNDTDGYITHKYNGLSKTAVGVVKFSICKSHFLAAGDDHLIKVWSVGNVELLATIEAEGGLPACPFICFNKTGSLLAVFADNSKIKILANDVGQQMLHNSSYQSLGSSGNLFNSLRNLVINASNASRARTENEGVPVWVGGSARTVRPNKALDTHTQKRLITLNAASCRSLRLPSDVNTGKICRLIYSSTGNELIALAADGIHLVWRWPGTDLNTYGWASTKYAPQLYRPESSGQLMTNDLSNDSSQPVSPFIALTKNDSYLMSGSGSCVSLFSTATSKKLGNYLMPPPVATCISYYPQDNNIIAAGMDDSTILIYNIQQSEVINKLQGHVKRVSGLTFSTRSKVLVSAGVDTQIIVWDFNRVLKKQSTWLEITTDWVPSVTAEINVQYFQDQKHILVVHETQLAIYETTNVARIRKWTAEQSCSRISQATLSSDNQLLYAVLRNGIILIFNAWDLIPAFDIDPSVYLPRNLSYRVYPQVVAENPQKPSQFAVGLSDGGVVVIEPPEFTGRWLALQLTENGSRRNSRTIIK